MIALIDPILFSGPVIFPWRAVFWNVNGAIVVGGWYVIFWLVAKRAGPIGDTIPLPSAVVITAIVFVLLHFNYWFASVLLGEPDLLGVGLYWDILRYSVVAIIFEVLVTALLLPALLFAMRKKPAEPQAAEKPETVEPEPCNTLDLNGSKRDLSDILYLKSAEHYVEVVFHDARELVRASLRDLVKGLEQCQGVQPHRSYCVPRTAIVGMNKSKGNQFLVLRNGAEIPVSRNRRETVAQWVQCSMRDDT